MALFLDYDYLYSFYYHRPIFCCRWQSHPTWHKLRLCCVRFIFNNCLYSRNCCFPLSQLLLLRKQKPHGHKLRLCCVRFIFNNCLYSRNCCFPLSQLLLLRKQKPHGHKLRLYCVRFIFNNCLYSRNCFAITPIQ